MLTALLTASMILIASQVDPDVSTIPVPPAADLVNCAPGYGGENMGDGWRCLADYIQDPSGMYVFDLNGNLVRDNTQYAPTQLPEEVIGRAVTCDDGQTGYIVDTNGTVNCPAPVIASPEPSPASPSTTDPQQRTLNSYIQWLVILFKFMFPQFYPQN